MDEHDAVRQRWLVPATLVAGGGAIAVLWNTTAVLAPGAPEWAEHAASHLAVGVPAALVSVVALRWWPAPQPSASAQLARRLLVGGIAGLGAFQLLEALSARLEYPTAGWLHTTAGILSMLALLFAAVGLVLSAVTALNTGTLPRWARIGVLVIAMLAALAVLLMVTGLGGIARRM